MAQNVDLLPRSCSLCLAAFQLARRPDVSGVELVETRHAIDVRESRATREVRT